MIVQTPTSLSGANVDSSFIPFIDVCGDKPSGTTPQVAFPPLEADPSSVWKPVEAPANPLLAYSLRGQLDELKKRAVDSVPFLGKVALLGQWTVFYAAPNTGKTLITLNLLARAVADGRVDPDKVFYVNMDDSSTGVCEKVAIAEQYGFHTIAGGEHNFKPAVLVDSLSELVRTKTAKGCVVVIDTLKKFVDLMQKSECTQFGVIARSFVQAGGTLVALAHTNKKSGEDGKAVYGGTADIVQDCDCMYVMTATKESTGDQVLVRFENQKKRGDVDPVVLYRYLDRAGVTYQDRFDSVTLVGEAEQAQALAAAMMVKDYDLIQFVVATLRKSSMNKTNLMLKLMETFKISRNAALDVIGRYCGDTAEHHLWSFDVVRRGANMFRLNLEIIAHFHPELSDF